MTSQSCCDRSAKSMVNSNVFALSHVSKDVFCARTYLKYVRASTASFSGFLILENVRDDENQHFFNMFMSINS